MSRSKSHDEFLELCAVATSGGLSAAEQVLLREHLAVCSACREAMHQYDAVAGRAAAAGTGPNPENLDPGPSWSLARAETSFFERLAKEEGKEEPSPVVAVEGSPALNLPHPSPFPGEMVWRHVWLQYAAALLLVVVLGVCAYQVGVKHGSKAASESGAPALVTVPVVEQQLSDASHEREMLRAEREQRDREMGDLRRQLAERSAELTRLEESQARLEAGLHAEDESKNNQRAQERTRLGQQLQTAQTRADGLQQKLDSLTLKSALNATQDASLQARIDELTRSLKDRDETIDRQQELLAHDRDIRELMGARDLYIAEVYDVARSGATQKPYGRVFYTKGKSLIFYAYDLDQQKGIRNASTFQVWGRRGPDWKQALSLGIFYEDNTSKKRWILRSNDPKALAQIDAVFVTVEPNGGSSRPSGKPFMFAYLQIDANHP